MEIFEICSFINFTINGIKTNDQSFLEMKNEENMYIFEICFFMDFTTNGIKTNNQSF